MEAALVYMWSGTRPGHEAAAMANYLATKEYLTRAQAEGAIRDFAVYLTDSGGPQMLIVRGELASLLAHSNTPESMAANMKAGLLNEGFRWGLYATGDSVDATMGLFVQMAEQVNA